MTTISSAQRVYDAKSPKKSVTSPEFPTPTHKRSTTAPQPIHRVAPPPLPKRTDEDVASEPDFIQDREEFLAELHKKNAAIIEKKKKDDKKMIEKNHQNTSIPEKSKAREEPKKTIAEKSKVRDEPRKSIPEKPKASEEASKTKIVEPQFTQAHELASEVHRTERIPENLHEEESATAYRHTVTGLNDQIVVSELTEVQKDKEIVVDKDGTRKIDEFVDDKTKDILRKVENVSAEFNTNFKSFTKDLKGAATPHVESKREAFMEAEIQEPNESSDRPPKKIHNHLASKTSELQHTVDSKLTDTVTKTESIVENLHQNILDDLRNTTNTSNRDEKKAPQLIIGDMPSKI
ncbi:hypothetical protein DICVIV_10215 [Dictyocaulus viviparus]|uniref:Uncharacterized protein n=1 Tax=Dictyocaulus viviparus TaxID=29172 RepID=A0A0D8XGP4_DICVI|nr:hypothetical protein DICVIV_10215 [Dictyocaulus viviparus]